MRSTSGFLLSRRDDFGLEPLARVSAREAGSHWGWFCSKKR